MVETIFIGEHDPTSRKRKKPAGEESTIELPSNCWVLYTNGSATKERLGVGIVLESPDGEHTIQDIIKFKFPASNNQAKYEALKLASSMDQLKSTTSVTPNS